MFAVEQSEPGSPGGAEPSPSRTRDLARGVGTSLISSALGSVAGAIGWVVEELLRTGTPETAAQWVIAPVAIVFVALVAMTLAVPSGLLLGPVMLRLAGDRSVRRPLAMTVVFGIVGLLAASSIHDLLDHGVQGPDKERWVSMLFGATVGAAHPLVAFHRARRLMRRTLLIAATAALLVGAAGRLTVNAMQNARARREYTSECQPGAAAFALRPDLLHRAALTLQDKTSASRPLLTAEQGEWWPLRGNDAVLYRYSALLVDGERTLAVNDLVLAPVTPWSRLGFPRKVEAHCLATLTGAPAQLARRAALVQPPSSTPRPPRWF